MLYLYVVLPEKEMMSHALIRKLRAEIKDTGTIKVALDKARKEFNERKAIEWAAVKSQVMSDFNRDAKEYQIRQAMLELRLKGESISAICESYGTKDRATVTRQIEQAKKERDRGVVVGGQDEVFITPLGGDTWSVEVVGYSRWEVSSQTPYSGTVVVLNDNGMPSVDEDATDPMEFGSPLHRELVSASLKAPLMMEWTSCVTGQK